MKTTVDQLSAYSFCPKLYEQDGSIDYFAMSSKDSFYSPLFLELLYYAFNFDFEKKAKVGFDQLCNKWKKIFKKSIRKYYPNEDEQFLLRLFNKSLIVLKDFHNWYLKQNQNILAINHFFEVSIYDYHLLANIPIVFVSDKGNFTLLFATPVSDFSIFLLKPEVRFSALALADQFLGKIEKIINLSITHGNKLDVFSFVPGKRYWEDAMIDFIGIIQSMQAKVTYPNVLACATCPIRKTCEVMKGNA